ncbi:MAG: sulfatase-like hydrolase/transferase [Verrucomicrobiota bacterium]
MSAFFQNRLPAFIRTPFTVRLTGAMVLMCALRASATPPNIVIIVTDDQGWGDVGYHTPAGQIHIDTPNMDSFATSGIRFENFYATAVCSVTRACLLTGRNSLRTGTNNARGVPLGEHLMPQSFKAAGYQTFLCGKWHLGGSDKNLSYTTVNGQSVRIIQEGPEYAPYNRGWDSHYGEYSGAIDCFTHISQEAENPDVPDWWLNGVQRIDTTDLQGHDGYSTDLLADKAVQQILSRDPSKPMLLYLAFNAIHGPVQAPPDYLAKYASIPDLNRRTIAASVNCMDTAIGRVLAALDSAGITNNTLVVWFGDNGGDETKGSLNDPLRGTKGDGYDGAIREPAGIRWPGVLPAGVVSHQYIWVGDLFPTICAATGVTAQNTRPFDGLNLWSALLSASNTMAVPRPVPLVTGSSIPVAFSTFMDPVHGGSKVFKLIRSRIGTNTVNELFNMSDDPYETSDLMLVGNAAAYSGILGSLTTAITGIAAETYPPYIGPPLITYTVAQGGSITLYAPFTSYKAPTVQWRKNGANISGGTATQITDTLGNLVVGAYTATLDLSNVSTSVAGTYDVVISNISGTTTSASGLLTVGTGGPVISSVATGPTDPTYLDNVWVTAAVQATTGQSLQSLRLSYDNGERRATTVFSETMRTATAQPWTGDLCENPWTVTATNANNVRQTTGANHSATDNPCGLEFNKGTANLADTMVATTNPINTAGNTTSVEFYLATLDLETGNGWAFQVSPDGGATYTTRLGDRSGANHAYQLYHYDLAPDERTTNLKLRFQMSGSNPGPGVPSPHVRVDDILVVSTTPGGPVTVAMLDDGQHGDGAPGDGIYGGMVPAQAGTTTVTYQITATGGNGSSTTSPVAGNHSYTVNASLTNSTIKSPEFLGIPTDDGITLNVVATSDQVAYVEYGTASGAYTTATPAMLFSIDASKPEFYNPIEIPITGLQSNTRYYYRLRHRATTATAFDERGERSFMTARPRGVPFVFTVTADPHLDVNTDVPLFTQAMANISADAPDLHIDLGDIFMTDKLADGVTGVPPEFGGGFFPNQSRVNDRSLMLRDLFARTCHSIPFFYTLGNHEAEYGYLFNAAADKQNNIPAWDLKARKAFFPTPVPSTFYTGNANPKDYSGGTLGLLEDYYAWEWGDALFIVLDPFWNTTENPNQANDAWKWTLGKPQYDWLQQTLENSSARYKFVILHHIIGGSTTLADGTTPNIAARGGIEVAGNYEWGGLNADGVTDGFAFHRPGWSMPIHDLLVQNKVNIVFHGHDHLYGYQTLDGIVYLECPQPGTANFTELGSAGDGKYSIGTLQPNSGHIRVTVAPDHAQAEYVRAYRASDETATRHNREVSHSFTIEPRVFSPAEFTANSAGAASFRWNAVANRAYAVQWSPDLVNWTTIDTVTPGAVNTNATYNDTNYGRTSQPRSFYRVSHTP